MAPIGRHSPILQACCERDGARKAVIGTYCKAELSNLSRIDQHEHLRLASQHFLQGQAADEPLILQRLDIGLELAVHVERKDLWKPIERRGHVLAVHACVAKAAVR